MLRVRPIFLLAALLAGSMGVPAQDNSVAPASTPATPKPPATTRILPQTHKFWDTENICLFSGVGAARMLDYASTRFMRDQGDHEVLLTNGIVDNRPLFVGIELAGTAASIGVSYLFHRTGHHSLERWVSIGHIGVGVVGSVHNYLLAPAPGFAPASAPGRTNAFVGDSLGVR
jgi:hypothetical protein